MPLPPGYQPVHHEPRYDDPGPDRRRPADSPWRSTQRPSGPETGRWPGQPANASYGEDPRGPGGDEFYRQDQYGRDQDQYEDGFEAGGRFVPGFGDYDDDGGARPGRADRGGRPSRGHRQASRQDGSRPPRRRRFRWIAPLFAVLVIFVPLAVGGSYAYSLYMSKYHPADYSAAGTGHIVVQVSSGESPTGLGPALQRLGVVASARAFVLAAEHSSNPNGLLPGFYGMREHMKASLAYAALLNPADLVEIKVTIPEGWRVSQTLTWLGAHSGISMAAYAKVLADPASLNLPGAANGKPEGYLFPDTYEIQPHETARGVLRGMVQSFDQEAAGINLPTAAKSVHLTQTQVITMASLVQAEGGRLSDYPKIARVIDNRLAQGIPLQLDSTVLYGLDTYGILASDAQLNSPSPYNTYRHKGLPPGPIDSPGNAAIQAVLHPASGNWVYFVTVNPKTGETLYTSSPAQFQQFRLELEKNLGQG
ncbi:MAG: endolytic transglycosylase MltG [Actinomycetota bacterium]|nr:endolytic transglycosylase MltG [Actinomycetota bacterium]